jgi:hypothetical protein
MSGLPGSQQMRIEVVEKARVADHPINRIDQLLPWNLSLSHS